MINVLKNGAATKQGIIDIIAANLGIADDIAFAKEAKETIQVVEFLPKLNNSSETLSVALFTSFKVRNESVTAVKPIFRFKLYDTSDASQIAIPTLFNFKIVNLDTKEFIQIRPVPGKDSSVRAGDSLIFLSNGEVLLRGVNFKTDGFYDIASGQFHIAN